MNLMGIGYFLPALYRIQFTLSTVRKTLKKTKPQANDTKIQKERNKDVRESMYWQAPMQECKTKKQRARGGREILPQRVSFILHSTLLGPRVALSAPKQRLSLNRANVTRHDDT